MGKAKDYHIPRKSNGTGWTLYKTIDTLAKRPVPVIPINFERTQAIPALYYTEKVEKAINFLVKCYNNGTLKIDSPWSDLDHVDNRRQIATAYERFDNKSCHARARRKKEQFYREVLGKEWKYGKNYNGSEQVHGGREREDRDLLTGSWDEQESDGTRTCDEGIDGEQTEQ